MFYLPTITEAPTENPLITLPMQITIKISEAVNENPTIETNVNKIKDNLLPIPFIRVPKMIICISLKAFYDKCNFPTINSGAFPNLHYLLPRILLHHL